MDLYRTECGTDNPLRCYVGDVSARVGTIGINHLSFNDQYDFRISYANLI